MISLPLSLAIMHAMIHQGKKDAMRCPLMIIFINQSINQSISQSTIKQSLLMLMCTALELKQHYDEQVKELVGGHQRELSQIRSDHKVELDRMQKALDVVSYQHFRLLFSTYHPQFDAHFFVFPSLSIISLMKTFWVRVALK